MAKKEQKAQQEGQAKERKPKKTCPISRQLFRDAAKPIPISIGGQTVVAGVKEFGTGSFGFYANGKVVMEIGGVAHTFQLGMNLTAVGSKDLPPLDE